MRQPYVNFRTMSTTVAMTVALVPSAPVLSIAQLVFFDLSCYASRDFIKHIHLICTLRHRYRWW